MTDEQWIEKLAKAKHDSTHDHTWEECPEPIDKEMGRKRIRWVLPVLREAQVQRVLEVLESCLEMNDQGDYVLSDELFDERYQECRGYVRQEAR